MVVMVGVVGTVMVVMVGGRDSDGDCGNDDDDDDVRM